MNNGNFSNSMNEDTVYDNVSEKTILDDTKVASEQVSETKTADVPKNEGKKTPMWKKVTIGTGSAIALGAAAAFVASAIPLTAEGAVDVAPDAADDGSISMATGVNDDMSFQEAFDAAREEVGPGGVFAWHGNLYNTYTADEWNNMSAEEQTEWGSHFEGTYQPEHDMAQHTNSGHSAAHAEVVQPETNNQVQAEEPIVAQEHPENTIGDSPAYVDHGNASVGGEEVEVLGVYHDNGNNVTYADVIVSGQDVVFMDVDNDETFDVVVIDENNNGQVEENEVHLVEEVFGQSVSVDDIGGYNDPMNNPHIAQNETDYINDDPSFDNA
ncbi:MAG: hypothetical protein LUC91_07630 [Prevotella sp.]|nr:hypothetical protein [Prevotella sp.]